MIVKKRSLTHLKQKQKRPFLNLLFLFGLMAMGFHNSKFEITPLWQLRQLHAKI